MPFLNYEVVHNALIETGNTFFVDNAGVYGFIALANPLKSE
jgi:hypothetical protein